MCLILFAFQSHSRYPLIVAANRDEFYDRPTAAAARWDDAPQVIAGRDLVGGGTWLGITDSGRFAAVTNYRDPAAPQGTRSRGRLVADFLMSNASPADYLAEIRSIGAEFSGFNVLVGSFMESDASLLYLSNREGIIHEVPPGIYGLSNHLLDTPWPKVRRGKEAFARLLEEDISGARGVFDLLADASTAPDDELPDTGIGIERERLLSPIFIRTPIYGTRCSTLVTFEPESGLKLEERVYV